METGKLTVTLSEIDEVKAQEVVNLTPKKRTLLGTLLASVFRSFWTVLTVRGEKQEVIDAAYEPVQENEAAEMEAETETVPTEQFVSHPEPVDEELNRIVGLFKLAREQGYTGVLNERIKIAHGSLFRRAVGLHLR